MERRILMDSNLAMGAKVSSKFIPSIRVYPWATRRVLFLTTVPCPSDLFLKIHLVPMIF